MRFPAPPFLLLFAAAVGCAAGPQPAPVTPDELTALESEAVRFQDDADELTRIGIRFYDAGRYTRAGDILTAALGLRPSFVTAVYLGLSAEAQGRFDDAETAYRAAATFRLTQPQERELDRRMAALARTRLAAEARAAIARETELSAAPPVAGSVAVLPWAFVGEDRQLAPLGAGVTQLVTTDLGQVSRLTLVERERIQALLAELALSADGHVDSATALRSGRLLRAEWVVAGLVRQVEDGVQLEATVFRTRDAAVQASGRRDDRLADLFDIESDLVLDLVDQLGVTMSPAERRAMSERPTSDLQAFLAFSEGLRAQQRGDYRTAGGLFTLAAGRDPAFGMARRLGDHNAALLDASRSSPRDLARVAASPAARHAVERTDALYGAAQLIAPSTAGILDLRSRSPITQPHIPEALGQDNPSRLAFIGSIIIVISRP